MGAVELDLGGVLRDADVAWSRLGNPGLPAVVVLGGISSGRGVATPDPTGDPGWWQAMVGPGRAVDLRRHCVIGLDFLGGAGASTQPLGPGFPVVTTEDQARALAAVLDHLRLPRVAGVIGSSYGGMVALSFAALFPDRVDRLVVISAAHRSHPMATALRTLQRRTVRLGLDSGHADEGMAIARGLAMTTYRTAGEFAMRFQGPPLATPGGVRFPVESYLEHHGVAFSRRFSPWSFLCLSESIDRHDVDPARIDTPTTLVAVESDTLVPAWQMREFAAGLGGRATLREIQSIYGHDAFLKEVAPLTEIIRTAFAQGGDNE